MALGFTIYNAKLDREYKELGIRPFLHLDVETSDFHVGIINTGLGPAEIKLIATRFTQRGCLYFQSRPRKPTDDESKATTKIFDSVLKPIDIYFADPLSKLTEPASVWDPPTPAKLYTRTLTPDEILPANKEVIIFQLQPDQLAAAQKRLQTFTPDEYNTLMSRFLVRAQSIPYYVNYCSLTGFYCVRQVEENFGAGSG